MKVKEHYIQEQQREFELDLSYAEWLRDNFSEPSEVELDLMEEDFLQSSSADNQIIAHKPLNNFNYENNQPTGA